MPKYYYTCPIKTLYMMKEFGVNFDIGNGAFRGYYNWENLSQFENDCLKYGQDFDRFDVAEESEHIFEPEKGDEERQSKGLETPQIIMRDNKPFFIPTNNNQ